MTAKELAEKQWETLCNTGESDGMISFVFDDVEIVNPWKDPSGRFDLSDEEAEKTYGKKLIREFVEKTRFRGKENNDI